MKRTTLLFAAWLLLMLNARAQNVAINTDGSLPNSNAMLDIKSGTKGLLIPRMSSAARSIIPNTKGLLVYDTTTSSFWYNTGAQWQNMAASLAVTDSAWLLTGNSGTVDGINFIGTTKMSPQMRWGCVAAVPYTSPQASFGRIGKRAASHCARCAINY